MANDDNAQPRIWVPETVSRPLLLAARRLRREMTEAECLLWEHLRAGRLGGWRFRRQHPVDRFVLDFYCPVVRLAVELDGAQHHTPDGQARDAERDDWLQRRHGIRMLRFDNAQLLRQPDAVLDRIRQALAPP
ncbi:endonuclease domain-containing protein [Sphaerotilus sp.]|uniref:endonuclease domain-containing protein n=1 Tax=Sphaerotilus sp. TaxID=2093942 RepID=UPI002ACEF611|nr:endonuclease domain-containing protein [Sphaerotilus sp.]MDZ7857746.1 endonuclease domain-containing protein [Sphaerotilus sp.]